MLVAMHGRLLWCVVERHGYFHIYNGLAAMARSYKQLFLFLGPHQ